MAGKEDVVWVQLATRIPKKLHRELKLHCVDTGTSVMAFVSQAIAEKLASSARPIRRSGRRRGSVQR
jgi:hypothetical protein